MGPRSLRSCSRSHWRRTRTQRRRQQRSDARWPVAAPGRCLRRRRHRRHSVTDHPGRRGPNFGGGAARRLPAEPVVGPGAGPGCLRHGWLPDRSPWAPPGGADHRHGPAHSAHDLGGTLAHGRPARRAAHPGRHLQCNARSSGRVLRPAGSFLRRHRPRAAQPGQQLARRGRGGAGQAALRRRISRSARLRPGGVRAFVEPDRQPAVPGPGRKPADPDRQGTTGSVSRVGPCPVPVRGGRGRGGHQANGRPGWRGHGGGKPFAAASSGGQPRCQCPGVHAGGRGRSPCPRRRRASRCGSRWRTPDAASRRSTCRISSSVFIAWTGPVPRTRAESGSVSPSCAASPTCTAAA